MTDPGTLSSLREYQEAIKRMDATPHEHQFNGACLSFLPRTNEHFKHCLICSHSELITAAEWKAITGRDAPTPESFEESVRRSRELEAAKTGEGE